MGSEATMTGHDRKLKDAPIIEAVVDFDCDMPPELDLEQLEQAARLAFGGGYPQVRRAYLAEGQMEIHRDQPPRMSARRGLLALQLLQEDEKQLVQVRTTGFSFNRLAPYTSLDNYLPEIERTWRLFVALASPVEIRLIRLRYINRIPLPVHDNSVELNDYFNIAPRLPDEERLILTGFINQHAATERDTGNEVRFVLASQPIENGSIPIIFDIEATREEPIGTNDWAGILSGIRSLRDLKNRVFWDSLTPNCLEMFQ